MKKDIPDLKEGKIDFGKINFKPYIPYSLTLVSGKKMEIVEKQVSRCSMLVAT